MEKLINDFIESHDKNDIIAINAFLDEILEKHSTPINEALFGSTELTDLFNKFLMDKSDSTRLELVEFINSNLTGPATLKTYSKDYSLEFKECGISMADVDILSKMALSFGTELANKMSNLDQQVIRYCIGYRNGKIADAIWVFSSPDFQVRVYSRLSDGISLFQSKNRDGTFGELIWKECCKFLETYQSKSTNSGLTEVLKKYEFGNSSIEDFLNQQLDCEFDNKKACQLFSIPIEELSYKCFRVGSEDSVLLAHDSLLSKLFVLGISDGFLINTSPDKFNSLYSNVMSLLTLDIPSMYKHLEPTGEGLVNYEVPPYSVMDKVSVNDSKNIIRNITFTEGDTKITLDDLGDFNYRLGIGIGSDIIYNELNSPSTMLDIFEVAMKEVLSNSNIPINLMRYKVALKLQAISKFM